MASAVGGTTIPASPTTSGSAPRSDTTTGAPQAMASATAIPNPSMRLGRQNAAAPAISRATSASEAPARLITGVDTPGMGASASVVEGGRVGPVGGRPGDQHQRVGEPARGQARHRLAQGDEVLARVEHRDEQHVGALRLAARGGDEEGRGRAGPGR